MISQTPHEERAELDSSADIYSSFSSEMNQKPQSLTHLRTRRGLTITAIYVMTAEAGMIPLNVRWELSFSYGIHFAGRGEEKKSDQTQSFILEKIHSFFPEKWICGEVIDQFFSSAD